MSRIMKTVYGTKANHPCETTEEPCYFEKLYNTASRRALIYRQTLEEIAREAGIEAGVASHHDDRHGLRTWSELQNTVDKILKTV
jgi:hypothetical protein